MPKRFKHVKLKPVRYEKDIEAKDYILFLFLEGQTRVYLSMAIVIQ